MAATGTRSVNVPTSLTVAGPVPPARRGHLLARWKGVPVAANAKRVRVALVQKGVPVSTQESERCAGPTGAPRQRRFAAPRQRRGHLSINCSRSPYIFNDVCAVPAPTGTPFRSPKRCPRRSSARQEEEKQARPHPLNFHLAGFPGLRGNETANVSTSLRSKTCPRRKDSPKSPRAVSNTCPRRSCVPRRCPHVRRGHLFARWRATPATWTPFHKYFSFPLLFQGSQRRGHLSRKGAHGAPSARRGHIRYIVPTWTPFLLGSDVDTFLRRMRIPSTWTPF
jgi:hypothetical protein